MSAIPPPEGDSFQPSGRDGIYLLPARVLAQSDPPWFIEGRRVQALAPHPDCDDLVYLTTDAPEALAFLPDPYVELD